MGDVWKYVDEDYEVIETLGQGSYGLVVKCKHKSTGQMRAIKMIKNVFWDQYSAN